MKRVLAVLLCLGPAAAGAESATIVVNGQSVRIQAPDVPALPQGQGAGAANGVTVNSSGQGNSSSVTIGGIGQDTQVQGVSVINGQVWIDGEKIPPTVTRYTSKSGQKYLIERTPAGVAVRTE